jgi:hypothetical protein
MGWMHWQWMGRLMTTLRRSSDGARSESGMATAELLGNAALGIAALVAIWAVLQAVGLDVMEWIRGQLQV